MKTPLCVLLLLCLVRTAVAADTTIGFQESELRDTHPDRPLQMVVWYPGATTEQPVLIADRCLSAPRRSKTRHRLAARIHWW